MQIIIADDAGNVVATLPDVQPADATVPRFWRLVNWLADTLPIAFRNTAKGAAQS
jgi:hypothetical protein